jgi:hypothetical protein
MEWKQLGLQWYRNSSVCSDTETARSAGIQKQLGLQRYINSSVCSDTETEPLDNARILPHII